MYIYTHTRAYTHSYAYTYTYTYTYTELWTSSCSYFYRFFLLNHLHRNSHTQMYATTELMFTPCIVRYHWWARRPIEFGSLRFPFTLILDGSTFIIITITIIYIYIHEWSKVIYSCCFGGLCGFSPTCCVAVIFMSHLLQQKLLKLLTGLIDCDHVRSPNTHLTCA